MREGASAQRIAHLDRWGMLVSAACLVHCLALPLAAAALPFMAVLLPHEEWTHAALLALALPVTGLALLRGYLRHRRAGPALLGVAGLALMGGALLAGDDRAVKAITVAGAVLCAAAHMLNWRSHRPGDCRR